MQHPHAAAVEEDVAIDAHHRRPAGEQIGQRGIAEIADHGGAEDADRPA